MGRFLPIACAAAALSSPAVAGWQTTNWGMTPEEVRAATNGNAAIGGGAATDRSRENALTVGNVGMHSSGWHQFRSVFYYQGNRLAAVKLKLLNGERGCGSLWADMETAYGRPIKDSRGQLLHFALWHDNAKNNRVSLSEAGETCTLDYQPLSQDNISGL
jgi:hypothetical protein